MVAPTEAERWYRISDIPPGAVHGIVVRWPGYEVRAASAVDKRGRRSWYEVKGKALEPLKAEPDAWRPDGSGRWTWPGGRQPEPLPTYVEPRLASIGKASFDAAEAAAEMEEWRETARVRSDDDAEPLFTGQWWRDVTQVKYCPIGSVTREMCEARVMRHLILERSLPTDLKRSRSNAAVLADLKKSFADVYGDAADGDWVPPLVAQPEDHADFLTVMGWFVEAGLVRRDLIVLRARMQSPPTTWVQIADALGRKPSHAKKVYQTAIDCLVEAANRPARVSVAKLVALQDRNRAARGRR